MISRTRLWMIILCLACASVSRADEKQELERLLQKWQAAWNSGDAGKLIGLFHPASGLKEAYDSNPQAKQGITAEFAATMKEFGAIEKSTVGKYIADEKKYVVQVSYRKRGAAAAKFAIASAPGGEWLVSDFDIDAGDKK